MVRLGKIGIGEITREIMVGDPIILTIEATIEARIMLEIHIGRIAIFGEIKTVMGAQLSIGLIRESQALGVSMGTFLCRLQGSDISRCKGETHFIRY